MQTVIQKTTDNAFFQPVRIVEIELSQQPFPFIAAYDAQTGRTYQQAQCLVRLHSQPLGLVSLTLHTDGRNVAREQAQEIWAALAPQINQHLKEDGLPLLSSLDESGIPVEQTPRCLQARALFLRSASFASVIVPTYNRPDRIVHCVQSLLTQDYPNFEILVVDNAPKSDATREAIVRHFGTDERVRYLCQPHPGVTWARNLGIAEARSNLLAFTDDDVKIDRHWLTELLRGFSVAPEVVCVTGLVLPLELETIAQEWFEQYGGFGKGFAQRLFHLKMPAPPSPLFPYTAGSLGTGANMAFKADYLRSAGGFDAMLEKAASDIEPLFQVIQRGHMLVYRPSALMYHPHNRDYEGLQNQLSRYGIGLGALLTKAVFEKPVRVFELAAKLPYGVFFVLSRRSPKNRKKSSDYPQELSRLERQGMWQGVRLYLQRYFSMPRQPFPFERNDTQQQIKDA